MFASSTSRYAKGIHVVAACVLAALAGCALLPEPTGAEVQAEALKHTAIPPNWSLEVSTAQVNDGWLVSFNDPVLHGLAREALAHNPDLLVAAARVEQANAQVDIAQAQLLPAIGLLGRTGSKPTSDLVPLLNGAVARVSWEIDLWGRLRYAVNAARAARDATGADYRFAQQSLAAAVARTWFVACETKQQQALAAEIEDAARHLLALAEQRKRVGAGSEGEVMNARASLASYEDARQQVLIAHRQALRALELLLGRYPGGALAANDGLTPFPGPVPAGIPMDVLRRRPDMIAAERRVAMAFDQVSEAKAAMLPTLSLSAGYGRLANSVVEVRDQLEQSAFSTSATGVVPLYTGGAMTGLVRVRTAAQGAAIAEYAGRALVALNDVEDALNAERILDERQRILREAVDANRRATALAEGAYRVGKSDLRAVHQQRVAAWSAEIALLHVQRERLSRRVDLHLALGGSFDDAAAPSVDQAAVQ